MAHVPRASIVLEKDLREKYNYVKENMDGVIIHLEYKFNIIF